MTWIIIYLYPCYPQYKVFEKKQHILVQFLTINALLCINQYRLWAGFTQKLVLCEIVDQIYLNLLKLPKAIFMYLHSTLLIMQSVLTNNLEQYGVLNIELDKYNNKRRTFNYWSPSRVNTWTSTF